MTNRPARSPATPSNNATKTLDPTEHTYMDVDYARKMIVHNQQGVKMADIAKESAVSEEVRSLAARISSELSVNTERYINWLKEWNEPYFNLSDYPEMDGHDMYPTDPGMASLTELSALETATSGSVDELFLRLMIAHHEGAAEIAKGLGYEKMQFGQIISLKNETLKKQAEEIQAMKQLEIKGN
jgi:uncharacterized protein (DUF305 family)